MIESNRIKLFKNFLNPEKVLELEERVTKPLTLALVRPEENEIISEAVKPVIQMEKVPKKPS